MDADTLPPLSPSAPLLTKSDRAPFEIINPNGTSNMLMACDHASRHVPLALGDLGLPTNEFDRHIAYDIGAEAVTRNLSQSMDARAVLAGYSRLVIDLNRPPGHPQSIPETSDGTQIPANVALSEEHINQRIDGLFHPYHEAVGQSVTHLLNRGPAPILFSVHSFTPHFESQERPWDVGILWKHDPRLAVPLMERLAATGLNVGDNEPYSALEMAYTIDVHAAAAGLASCVIEIRQDQISDEQGVSRWSEILHNILGDVLKDDSLFEVRGF